MLRAGEPGIAGERLEAACRMLDEKGVAIWMPELVRLAGEIRLLTHGKEDAEALARFAAARRLASTQGSTALALRAAMSEARALQAIERPQDAVTLIDAELARDATLPASRERRDAEALRDALRAIAGTR
jgi:predicted ATPase